MTSISLSRYFLNKKIEVRCRHVRLVVAFQRNKTRTQKYQAEADQEISFVFETLCIRRNLQVYSTQGP